MEGLPPPPPSGGERTRRPLLIAALVLVGLVAIGVVVALVRQSRSPDRSDVRDEARLAYPGAELVTEDWQDEEHARYIDTGGYDERAGWTFEYELADGATFVELCDFYGDDLVELGWQLQYRSDEAGETGPGDKSCTHVMGEGDGRTIYELEVTTESPGNPFEQPVTAYTVEYLLPWAEEPTYSG